MTVRIVGDFVSKPGKVGEAVEVLREVSRCIEKLSGVCAQIFYLTMGDGVGVRLTGYWDFESNAAYGEFTDRAAVDKDMHRAVARIHDPEGPIGGGFNRRVETLLT
jgi:hypothetical protein